MLRARCGHPQMPLTGRGGDVRRAHLPNPIGAVYVTHSLNSSDLRSHARFRPHASTPRRGMLVVPVPSSQYVAVPVYPTAGSTAPAASRSLASASLQTPQECFELGSRPQSCPRRFQRLQQNRFQHSCQPSLEVRSRPRPSAWQRTLLLVGSRDGRPLRPPPCTPAFPVRPAKRSHTHSTLGYHRPTALTVRLARPYPVPRRCGWRPLFQMDCALPQARQCRPSPPPRNRPSARISKMLRAIASLMRNQRRRRPTLLDGRRDNNLLARAALSDLDFHLIAIVACRRTINHRWL